VDTDHASRLRQAIANENADRPPHFIDPESKYPVIVLDREVGSMTEFKQIVGRGTRVHEDLRPPRRHCEPPTSSGRDVWEKRQLGGLYRLGFQQLWPAGLWYMVSGCERGSESGLTFLVRSLPATFPFNSVCRSDHSGWNPSNH